MIRAVDLRALMTWGCSSLPLAYVRVSALGVAPLAYFDSPHAGPSSEDGSERKCVMVTAAEQSSAALLTVGHIDLVFLRGRYRRAVQSNIRHRGSRKEKRTDGPSACGLL